MTESDMRRFVKAILAEMGERSVSEEEIAESMDRAQLRLGAKKRIFNERKSRLKVQKFLQ